MRKYKSVISVDKLTLCYKVADSFVCKLNECDEIIDSDGCFRLVRVPSDEALFANSFNVMIKFSFGNAGGIVEKKLATLKCKLQPMELGVINYVWLYVENWAFYETFSVIQGKHNWLSCIDYVSDELGLSFNNITDLHIAMDTNINFAKKIRRAQFNDNFEVILNGTFRSDKKEILGEIRYVQTGDQSKFQTLSAYISPKKHDGLSLKIYDKKKELEKSNKSYVPLWNGLTDSDYRVELTLKNEHLKEFYKQKGEIIPDELLVATLASQQQSQTPLFDMLLYFSNRLLRFRVGGKPISIFQL